MTILEEATISFISTRKHADKITRSDSSAEYTYDEYTEYRATRYVMQREHHEQYPQNVTVIEHEPGHSSVELRRLGGR